MRHRLLIACLVLLAVLLVSSTQAQETKATYTLAIKALVLKVGDTVYRLKQDDTIPDVFTQEQLDKLVKAKVIKKQETNK